MTERQAFWLRKGLRRYVYRPGLMDLCDPNVIEGCAIRPCAVVVISKRIGQALAWIVDCHGNEQSVWKRALVPVKARHVRPQGRYITYTTYVEA